MILFAGPNLMVNSCVFSKPLHLRSLIIFYRGMITGRKINIGTTDVRSTKKYNTELLELCQSIIPPLTYYSHKGQHGRVGIIGGSKEYTGAPYFAGISALKAGADLVHIFSSKDSSPIIKSYSPDLIVHPLLDVKNGLEEMKFWMERIHSVVIGPGLGRDENVSELLKAIIPYVKKKELPLIIDADGLWFINKNPEIIKGYHNAILTPNEMEFFRLFNACRESTSEKQIGSQGEASSLEQMQEETLALSTMLGNVIVVRKGRCDVMSNGTQVILCDSDGSPRRCGGQGDLLSGFIGTFTSWAYNSSHEHPLLTACYASCLLTKHCSMEAFKCCGRSTTCSDLIVQINSSFIKLFGA